MERLILNRTKLMQKVYNTNLDYEMEGDTSSILWDWSCDTSKFMNWLMGYENAEEPFYIYIRQSGCEAGTIDYVCERCSEFGGLVLMIKIEKESNIDVSYKITLDLNK